MTAPPPRTDATGEMFRRLLGILLILLLCTASLWILAPFLTSIIWATTVAVTTWPMLTGLQNRLGGRRGLAAAALTIGMLLIFFVPVLVLLAAIVNNAGDVARWAREIAASGIPAAPAWVAHIPAVGTKAAERWNAAAVLPPEQFVQQAMPVLRRVSAWLLSGAGGLALVTMQFLLTALITAILYLNGEAATSGVIAVARRIAGDRGQEMVELAGKSVRGVALGVVGTALIQTAISAVAMLATGVPGAILLSGAALFLCLAQVGPLLVLAPATGWLYWSGHPVAGTVLLVVTLFTTTVDNVLRPILIKRGADLPLLLVFSGVIGGMLAGGIIGIFVGPVVLAVTWTLLKAWVTDTDVKPA